MNEGFFITLQNKLDRLRQNRLFEACVIFVIIFSALVIGAKTFPVGTKYEIYLNILDFGITLFFLLEIVVRMIADKSIKKFFSQGWNVFDFIIVSLSLIPTGASDLVLVARLLRIFRVLRLISVIPELRVLISALLQALPRMGYVALLMFIIFYIYAAVGSSLFIDINPKLWGNIAISLLTLFRVATFEDWTDVMYETMEVYPVSWLFYFTFIFLTAFVFLNMMIGIVVEVLQEEQAKHKREQDVEKGTLSPEEQNAAIMEELRYLRKRLDQMN
jgi:voltage-gated sodium channel